MTNYGSAIGNIIGTTLVVHTVSKHLIPQQKKLLRKIKMKGGYKVKKRR